MIRLFKFKLIRFSVLLFIIGLLLSIGFIPLQLFVTLYQVRQPQAILVLGGDTRRVTRAAYLAQENLKLRIWVSDFPFMHPYYERLLQTANISPARIQYDFCATDTVTNFTCTVQAFSQQKIRHVYLVTSDYHMKRAKLIATLIFGSRGIVVTPIFVPAPGASPESPLRMVRDGIRSVFWLITGRTGASLNPRRQASNFSQSFLNKSCSYSSMARSQV